MGTTQNVIEINGKKYNAVTGTIIENQPKPRSANANPIFKPAAQKPVVDGFVRRPKNPNPARLSNIVASPKVHLQKSQTLMRKAVKKPTKHLAEHIKSVKQTSGIKNHVFKANIQKHSTGSIDPKRKLHAAQIKKSGFINRFGSTVKSISDTHILPHKDAHVKPLKVQSQPPAHQDYATFSRANTSPTADLLDKALQAAQGHNEQPYKYKHSLHKRIAKKIGISGRAMAVSSAVLAGLLLGGFYAYQNVPNLAMRVAAARAGFGATMPSYHPSGFSFKGPVQYSAGQVIVSFKSNTDDRNYHLTQQASNWNSDSLLNNFVVASGKEYQTAQDKGRTIYIFDRNSATWVNGGVWYQLDGKSDLTSDQIVRIAASL